MRKIPLSQARSLILQAQGLLQSYTASLPVLEQLGYVQIDTISVVQRAHHHVLWSRVPAHEPRHLAELLAEKKIFEFWSHAASYLPMRDFRFSLPRKRRYASGEWHWFKPTPEHRQWRRKILRQIRERGPQAARDFIQPGDEKRNGWFDWRPAKQSLEQLFMEGTLMVSERKGFNKFYDLSENVLPPDVDTRFPSPKEFARHAIFCFLNAQVIGRPEQISYLRRTQHELIRTECKALLKEGALREVKVEGIEKPFLTLAEDFHEIRGENEFCRILSPFDNFLIQRKRTKELFDFDYTIECYVPQAKRKFGYFGLPILLNGELLGQLDLKADRAKETLIVQAEQLPRLREVQVERLRETLAAFARFNGCRRILHFQKKSRSARIRSPLAQMDLV